MIRDYDVCAGQPDTSVVAAADTQVRFEAGFSSSIRFCVSEGMVANFAALTGDQSALYWPGLRNVFAVSR
jgi:hypothetical protein